MKAGRLLRTWLFGLLVFVAAYALYLFAFISVMFILQDGDRLYPSLDEALARYEAFGLEPGVFGEMVNIAANGYERAPFTLDKGPRNWAYLPLYPYLMRWIGGATGLSYFWSLFAISAASLFLFWMAIYYLYRIVAEWRPDAAWDAILASTVFGLSPLLLHNNFLGITLAGFAWALVILLRICLKGDRSVGSVVALCAIVFVIGLSRAQGLMIGVGVVLTLALWNVLTKNGVGWRIVAAVAVAQLAAWVALGWFYYDLCGEPFAYTKIQAVFNRPLTWPWLNKRLQNITTYGYLSSRAYESPVILMRLGGYIAAAALLVESVRRWSRTGYERSQVVWYCIAVIGLAMVLLPLSTNILHAFHRLTCFGFAAVLAVLPDYSRPVRRGFVAYAVLMQVFSHVLFMDGHPSLAW